MWLCETGQSTVEGSQQEQPRLSMVLMKCINITKTKTIMSTSIIRLEKVKEDH